MKPASDSNEHSDSGIIDSQLVVIVLEMPW